MKANATRLIRTFMILTMGFLVLSQLFLHSADNAYSQVMSTIDRTRFRPSAKEYPSCKVRPTTSFSQQVINILSGKLEADLVQLDATVYCIHLKDAGTANTQSLIIEGYDFIVISTSDLLYYGQDIISIQFHFSFTDYLAIQIIGGKLVLRR
jgi:hypothetical protein